MHTFNFDNGKLFFKIILICNSNTMCESSLRLHSKHLVFLNSNILPIWKTYWCLMGLICIFMITNEVEHLFIVIWIFFLCTCLSCLLSFFLLGDLWFYYWFLGILYVCVCVFRLHCVACRILVPLPGIEPRPIAVKAWSLNHQTSRDFPICVLDTCHSVITVVVYPYHLFWMCFFAFCGACWSTEFLSFNVVTFINFG